MNQEVPIRHTGKKVHRDKIRPLDFLVGRETPAQKKRRAFPCPPPFQPTVPTTDFMPRGGYSTVQVLPELYSLSRLGALLAMAASIWPRMAL